MAETDHGWKRRLLLLLDHMGKLRMDCAKVQPSPKECKLADAFVWKNDLVVVMTLLLMLMMRNSVAQYMLLSNVE